MSSMRPYTEYKESGVDWIGDIPSHWQQYSLKALLVERKEKNNPVKTENILSLMMGKGVIPYSEKEGGGNKAKDDLTAYMLAYPGDIVLNSMNVVVGSVGLSKYYGAISPVYYALYPRKPDHIVEYYSAIFQSKTFQQNLIGLGNGILVKISDKSGKMNTIRMRIPMSKLNTVLLPCPPPQEQKIISEYLDRETARIDNLIAEKQNFINLLKEKRQAFISHLVTKGLDPKVKMKDSGLEWVGEVPEHWEVKKLKYSLKSPLMYGANEAALDDNPSNPRFIRITDMNDDGTLKDSTFKSLPMDVAGPYILSDNDVLLARSGATVGKSFIYRDEFGPACFAGYLIKATLNRNVLSPEFLYLYTASTPYWEYIKSSQIQATIQNVSAEKYANMLVPTPSRTEQDEIVQKLGKELHVVDSLASEVRESIDLLIEHRTALISAAVTGKIDVRNQA